MLLIIEFIAIYEIPNYPNRNIIINRKSYRHSGQKSTIIESNLNLHEQLRLESLARAYPLFRIKNSYFNAYSLCQLSERNLKHIYVVFRNDFLVKSYDDRASQLHFVLCVTIIIKGIGDKTYYLIEKLCTFSSIFEIHEIIY